MEVGEQRKAFLLRVEFTSPVHRLVVLEEAQIVSPFVSQVAGRLQCLPVGKGDCWAGGGGVVCSPRKGCPRYFGGCPVPSIIPVTWPC